VETVHTGGRPLTRAALAGGKRALEDGRTVSRRELAAAGRDAAKALRLRPALRALLSALCAVWGEQEWDRLIVWPSNQHLCAMTGLSERALRYGLRDLIALELITPRDSANGKRYAVRAPGGAIIDAFGFDLTPVVARAGEWVIALRAAAAEEEARGRAFDTLTRHRRAIDEALSALGHYPLTAQNDLAAARDALLLKTPRRRGPGALSESLIEAWGELRTMAEDRFYEAASAGNSSRHLEQNTGPSSNTWTRAQRAEPGPSVEIDPVLVVEACPILSEFSGGPCGSDEILEIGRTLRSSIGAHHSAWDEACENLGRNRAAILVLIVAQLQDDDTRRGENRMRNPGGYFRKLVRLAREGRYGIEVELQAMRRRRMT
jgi:replication initiation protein RepC